MKEKNNMMKTVALWLLLLVVILSVVTNSSIQKTDKIEYSDFVSMLQNNDDNPLTKITTITINDKEITGKYTKAIFDFDKKDSKTKDTSFSFRTVIPDDPGLMDIIRKAVKDKGLIVRVEPPAQMSWWLNLLINWFPFIILIGVGLNL